MEADIFILGELYYFLFISYTLNFEDSSQHFQDLRFNVPYLDAM